MKKNFLLGFIAFAAMAVTSCTNDEMNEFIPQEKAIEFGTYIGRDAQSRGSIEDAETLEDGFGVLAYQYTTSTDYGSANFMNNVEVSGAGWNYTDTKYWPTDISNKIDFLAYGPYSADDTNVDVSGKTLTLTVPTDDVADQTDLVVATPRVGLYNGDEGKSGLDTNDKVAFTFKHMLSRIAFYAMAASDYDAEITITDISLTGKFHNRGTVDLSAAAPAITGTEVEAPASPSEKEYQPALTGEILTDELAMQNETSDYLMLIPAEAQNLSLSITYDVKYTDDTVVTNTITKQINSQAFAAGTAYAINMSISLNEVAFSVTVTSWGNETAIPNSDTIVF